MSDSAFSRRTLYLLFGITLVSFAVGLVFAVRGKDPAAQATYGANGYSRSAVGHRAFVRVLHDLGEPVVVSQYSSGRRAGDRAVLVLLEPATEAGTASLTRALERASRVLLVLPKWRWVPHETNTGWIGAAALEPSQAVKRVIENLLPASEIVRLAGSASREWKTGSIAIEPDLGHLQLVTSPYLVPIISTADGILLGETQTESGTVVILSDPDVISNSGLARGDNALLALRVIDYLRDGRGAIVIDETLHGFTKEPSIWRALFEFPLLLATLTALMALFLLIWAAIGRFGAPAPTPPSIEPGKAFLIDNTASLLQFGQHGAHTLSRYLATALQDAAVTLHAPAHLQGGALQEWLERVAATRGVSIGLRQIVEEIAHITSSRRPSQRNIILAANRLYSWKREILRGSTDHPAS